MDESEAKQDANQETLLTILESLRKASKDLQKNTNPIFFTTQYTTNQYSTIENLSTQAETVFSNYPNLARLTHLVFNLKTLLQNLRQCQGRGVKCLFQCQLTSYKIYTTCLGIESEIQGYIDREQVNKLVETLQDLSCPEEEQVGVLEEFRDRLSKGFDRDFQELVLKKRVFYMLETLVCDSNCRRRIRDQAGVGVLALVKFNKDVFVGLVLMGPIINALISMASDCSLWVLCLFIKLIRTPLIDEMESRGEIPKVLDLLGSENLCVRLRGVDCICEMAYIGRKEVVKAMLEHGVVEKLVVLQRSSLIGSDQCNGLVKEECVMVDLAAECQKLEGNSMCFGCVSRFAVEVEVGEGLSGKEKKEFKLEILRRVREACVSESEAASIVAEVLWGSSP